MLDAIKNFINDANRIIRRETNKINTLHKEIGEYETLIYIIGNTEASGQVLYYKEKINKCYTQIDTCLENINNSRDRIATMRMIDNIIERGVVLE